MRIELALERHGSPRIIMKVRMFAMKAAMMKYISAWAGCILGMKVERPTNVSLTS
jgi:hypothetical protein